MGGENPSESADIHHRMVEQIRSGAVRFTVHAHQEMLADGFGVDDVLGSLPTARTLEDYPNHKRGSSALFGGVAPDGRPVHIVATTANPVLIVITVYEPKPPKWLTPTQRNR